MVGLRDVAEHHPGPLDDNRPLDRLATTGPDRTDEELTRFIEPLQ